MISLDEVRTTKRKIAEGLSLSAKPSDFCCHRLADCGIMTSVETEKAVIISELEESSNPSVAALTRLSVSHDGF